MSLKQIDRKISRLERWLEASEPAEPVGVHVRGLDGEITPPLSTDEREGRKQCIVAQTVDGRRKH